jgi:WhiB family redox-sensing transcriptional regulator
VIEQCRRHALTVREPYGVWGGLTEDDREAVYSGDRRRGAAVAS